MSKKDQHKHPLLRWITRMGFLFLLLVLFVGCGKSKPSLTFMRWGDAMEIQYTQSFIEQFEKEHDVDIHLIIFPWANYETKVKLMIAADILPDVILIDRNFMTDIYDMDAILPMNELMENDPNFEWDDFLFRKSVTIDGKIMGIPENGGGLVCAFNREIFTKLNLKDPLQIYLENPDNWNLKTFENLARSVTRDVNGNGRYDWYGSDTWNWIMPLLSSFYIHGADFANADATKITMDTPEILATIKYLYALYQPKEDANGRMLPPAFQDPQDRVAVPGATGFSFQAGNIGMRPMTPGGTLKNYFEQEFDFDWDLVPFPRGPAGFKISGGGNPLSISRNSKNAKLAYEFCKYLTSKEIQRKKIVQKIYFFPTRQSMLNSEDFHNNFKSFNHLYSNAYVASVDEARMVPFPTQVRNLRKIFRQMTQGIDECMLGFQTPEETVAKLQIELNETLQEGRKHIKKRATP